MNSSNYSLQFNQTEKIAEWVCRQSGYEYTGGHCTAIGLLRNTELVAGALYDHYTGRSIAMHFAIKKEAVGCHRLFLHSIFAYPFEQLKVGKVLGLIAADHTQAKKIATRCGFSEEARLQNVLPSGDLLIFSLSKDECKYL